MLNLRFQKNPDRMMNVPKDTGLKSENKKKGSPIVSISDPIL